jgi:hypothetical protein
MSAETIGSAAVPDENRLPEGFEPLACRLQEVGSHALSALAAPMTQAIALTAPAALGLFGVSFHADGGTTVHSGNRAQWAAPGAVTPQLDMVRQDR